MALFHSLKVENYIFVYSLRFRLHTQGDPVASQVVIRLHGAHKGCQIFQRLLGAQPVQILYTKIRRKVTKFFSDACFDILHTKIGTEVTRSSSNACLELLELNQFRFFTLR